mmetsp:Transcript_7650/g.16811  ORF Transcript_7650/g.16811 Transcript_7650/m.16811 type:complete len:201 (-) Transcript_7650:715-1317(-)
MNCSSSSFSTMSAISSRRMPRAAASCLRSRPPMPLSSASVLGRRAASLAATSPPASPPAASEAPPPALAAPLPPPCDAGPPAGSCRFMRLTISATLALASLEPPFSTAACMKTLPMMRKASPRLCRSSMGTEWSRKTLFVTAVSVRSISTTDTCHMTSRKMGRLSCVACMALGLRPERGSVALVSVAESSSLALSSLTAW